MPTNNSHSFFLQKRPMSNIKRLAINTTPQNTIYRKLMVNNTVIGKEIVKNESILIIFLFHFISLWYCIIIESMLVYRSVLTIVCPCCLSVCPFCVEEWVNKIISITQKMVMLKWRSKEEKNLEYHFCLLTCKSCL